MFQVYRLGSLLYLSLSVHPLFPFQLFYVWIHEMMSCKRNLWATSTVNSRFLCHLLTMALDLFFSVEVGEMC